MKTILITLGILAILVFLDEQFSEFTKVVVAFMFGVLFMEAMGRMK
jgi:hypothetical protein